jgi:S-layer protein
MTYSVSQLEALFTNANEGFGPDASVQSALAALAQQDLAGAISDAQALNNALHIAPPADGSIGPNTPENTTDVALTVYQFFTGFAPTLAGLDFLVNGGGNPNDLDSAYYAGFNQANRYYNFALNLVSGNQAVATSFASTYGKVTFDQAVNAAYEAIVGTPNVGQAQAQAAIAAVEAQQPYFEQVAAERAPNVNQDLATKAIMVAYILEEGVKADVGYYASAIDQFGTELATGAAIPGETEGGVNILTGQPYMPLNVALVGGETVQGFASPGFTDVITGGGGHFVEAIGTINGGNTDVNFGGANDDVFIYSGTHNEITVTGTGFMIYDYSSGADTINVPNDYYSFLYAVGPGDFTINVGGTSDGEYGDDTIQLGTGLDTVSIAAGDQHVSIDLGHVPVSFAAPTTLAQASVDASKLDVISGLGASDYIFLPTAAAHDTLHLASNLAGVSGEALLATGTLAGGVFTLDATGHDALLTYDNGAGGFVSVVLAGAANEAAHASISSGVVTF